ncbi:hypothetical protein K491DRAFT_717073 [Lophiostoma macrostomum CBS 122681]|uniref:Peptidase M12A domain-containing protein n=1 Tax=Lophiostoma macrostomum CBS 122681 TaxID=1314788 RepID=A0A6A6T318_9PLEO|nr:hypothetical protein K491DRAFT_717073 [Lophiostoma macrostomum CBS 122681]
MQLVSLISLVFVAASVACPLTPRNSTVQVSQRTVGPQHRWAHHFNNEQQTFYKWPANENGVSDIKYCFHDGETLLAVRHQVERAWGIWKDALGGDWGSHNGHRLDFHELKQDAGWSQTCYKYEGRKGWKEWNPDVPADTLEIRLTTTDTPVRHMFTSYAYTPPQFIDVKKGTNNHMQIVRDAYDWEIAHELGHVLGLDHEHQRPDRNFNVYFNCEALAGYAEVKRLANDDGIEMGDVCENHELWDKYKDRAPLFMPNDFATDMFPWEITSGSYDPYSIMHYYSSTYAQRNNECVHELDKTACPLMKYRTGELGPNAPMDYITPNKKPSLRDIEGIKALYKWGSVD